MKRRHRKWVLLCTAVAFDTLLGIALQPVYYTHPLTPYIKNDHIGPYAFAEYDSPVERCTFLGKDIVIALLKNGAIEARQFSTRKRLWRVEDYGRYEGVQANEIWVLDKEQRIAAWHKDGFVWIFDARTGAKLHTFDTGTPSTWSISGRYFMGMLEEGVVADTTTGATTPTTLINTCQSTVDDAGNSYAFDGPVMRWHRKDQTVEFRSSSQTQKPSWHFDTRSITSKPEPRISISVRKDFTKVSDLQVSPAGNSLVVGYHEGAELEFVDLAELRTRVLEGETPGAPPVRTTTVRMPAPLYWNTWLHDDLYVTLCREEDKGNEELLAFNRKGELLMNQRDSGGHLAHVSKYGSLSVWFKNGQVKVRRLLGASVPQKWILDAPGDKNVQPVMSTAREKFVAVSDGPTIRFYEIPAP